MKQKPNWPKIKKTLEKNGFPKSIIERQEKSWDRFKTALEEEGFPEHQIMKLENTECSKCISCTKEEDGVTISQESKFEWTGTPISIEKTVREAVCNLATVKEAWSLTKALKKLGAYVEDVNVRKIYIHSGIELTNMLAGGIILSTLVGGVIPAVSCMMSQCISPLGYSIIGLISISLYGIGWATVAGIQHVERRKLIKSAKELDLETEKE